jgi:hypothetical protein
MPTPPRLARRQVSPPKADARELAEISRFALAEVSRFALAEVSRFALAEDSRFAG